MHVLLENVENKGRTWTDVDPYNKNTNASDEYLKTNPTTKLCYEQGILFVQLQSTRIQLNP